ncbi:MAG: tRNA (adenosine(37)-N6)-dimethylallyltransferase MiaA [Candidatus Paceibacterota bacterium]|jgi:tRNA dimethylallyltransferase
MSKKVYRVNNSIIVILGPTASGKSDLAVKLAKKHDGEIISADSRQVYKGLNIGTGKITKKEMRGVPHHLLDVADPKKRFTVAEYQKLAREKISEIFSRNHLPIICGGTGFYIQSIVDGTVLPDVPPNEKLREKLNKKTAGQLFQMLQTLDPVRAKNIDSKNPRRLVRAIEIAKDAEQTRKKRGTNAENFQHNSASVPHSSALLQIGIKTDNQILREKILIRLIARIKRGMIAEAKKLHKNGLSWKRMEELGLEYRYLARYLQNKITREQMIERLSSEIWQYVRRQKTWWRGDARIKWFSLSELNKIECKIKKFLKQKKTR